MAFDRNLLLFSVVVEFREFGFSFEKQFIDHLALLKIGRDLAQCPIVFNVLLYDKPMRDPSESCRSLPADACVRSILFAYFV